MKLVVGNQKAYLQKSEVINFIEKTKSELCKNAVICPSSLYMEYFKENSSYILGGQNVAMLDTGTATGEITAKQLKEMNAKYTIVGHSERRANQKEDSEMLVGKIKRLYENEITSILCVGEGREVKEQDSTKDFVGKQLIDVLDNLTKEEIASLVIAYEPVWAISTGGAPSVTPTNEEIADVVSYIKDLVNDKYEVSLKVLYGGSVNSKNIETLNEITQVDGYLIGGASVKPDEFNYIMEKCLQ